MLSLTFNPFDCDLDELKTSDLQKLQQVAEGWYVEYKRELITTRKIAKSLAAFANHYGGWIFYGVQDSDDGSNLAGAFPGLDTDNVSCLIESLRNAAKDIIAPSPYYEYKFLHGPCTEINLPDDRAVVVVVVPSGPDAPYIHSDGRIYRRVADSSDPKPETDRFILDQLWQRRQQSHAKLSSLLETVPTLSKGEDNVSFIDLFLLPDPLGASGQRSELTMDEFIEIMSDRTAPGISLSCDNFFTMADGMIGRDVNVNDPYNLVFTWRFFSNGSSILSIPMSSAIAGSITVGGWLNGYEQEGPIIQLIQQSRHSSNYLLDVNTLVFVVIGAIAQQKRLMRAAKIEGPLYAKATLHNIWRRVPFLDTKTYIEFVQKYGLPAIQFDDEYAPPGKTFDSLLLITEQEPKNEDEDPALLQALEAAPLISFIGNALGLSSKVLLSSAGDWWVAAERSRSVSKLRFEQFNSFA